MKLFSAGLKFIGRTLNDAKLTRDLNKAKDKSFNQTKKDIAEARKKGKYINGRKRYRENYRNNVRAANSRHNNRDKFISDL